VKGRFSVKALKRIKEELYEKEVWLARKNDIINEPLIALESKN